MYSILRHRQDHIVDRMALELPEGSRVQDVLETLNVAPELEAFVAVNGIVVYDNPLIIDGDEVAIIPSIAGGGLKK